MNAVRIASALVVASAVFVALAPASVRESRYGGTLVVGLGNGDPSSLDPTSTGGGPSLSVLQAICERLYRIDARAEIVPQLAAAMPTISADKLTYTIPLRKGVVFNDGTPFNALAVVTTLERDMNFPASNTCLSRTTL
jgi:peptide/nickel transport system substrate-binding protein